MELVGTTTVAGEPGVKGDAGTTDSDGVQGFSASGNRGGIIGVNRKAGAGTIGQSELGDGVQGFAKHVDHAGVIGVNTSGVGVSGRSDGHDGIQGFTKTAGKAGVVGVCDESVEGNGVLGRSKQAIGVVGVSSSGIGVLGRGGRLAGRFEGHVEVTGDIRLVNGDCAEDFDVDVEEQIDPGTVLVISDDGLLRPSRHAYDHRVAGVVSGAGDYRPGLILDNQGQSPNRRPIALLGKVYCKVDAAAAPISVGTLLTTSNTPGHAMPATDPTRLAGAVIGKALQPLSGGNGLIPILVSLQ